MSPTQAKTGWMSWLGLKSGYKGADAGFHIHTDAGTLYRPFASLGPGFPQP